MRLQLFPRQSLKRGSAIGDRAWVRAVSAAHGDRPRRGPRKSEPAISRVLSTTTIHLGQPSPTASSDLPGSPLGTGGAQRTSSPIGGALRCATPLFGLAPGGVYRAANCYQSRGALLPHLFTLPRHCPAVYFLWHFPWAHTLQALPGALSDGARTFLCDTRCSDCLAHSGISGPAILRSPDARVRSTCPLI